MEAFTVNEFDSRIYNTTMILQNILNNKTMVIMNANSIMNGNSSTFNSSQWNIVKYPEVNPATVAGFDVGLWKCLVIMVGLMIGLRILSLIFLKLLVSKFQ